MQETVKENQTIESGKERKRERERDKETGRQRDRETECVFACVCSSGSARVAGIGQQKTEQNIS